MLKNILVVLGWILIVTTLFNISIKLFGDDHMVSRYAGSSRNVDAPSLGFAIGLIFLGISSIIGKLDELLKPKTSTPD